MSLEQFLLEFFTNNVNVIGNGVVIDPVVFIKKLKV
jgi:adenylosuccinate synthase